MAIVSTPQVEGDGFDPGGGGARNFLFMVSVSSPILVIVMVPALKVKKIKKKSGRINL